MLCQVHSINEEACERNDAVDYPGEKLAIKVVDVLSSAIAAPLKPYLLRAQGRAANEVRADELRRLALL